jgi:hypothetical protein
MAYTPSMALILSVAFTQYAVFSHWISNFVVVKGTPIGLDLIQDNYVWVWTVICASFVSLTYLSEVETSGRTLEQIDAVFYEEPKLCMGLDPENRRVVRGSKVDEEQRYRQFAHAHGMDEVVMLKTVSQSD